eukprot:3943569-Amphidinium_carterae.1
MAGCALLLSSLLMAQPVPGLASIAFLLGVVAEKWVSPTRPRSGLVAFGAALACLAQLLAYAAWRFFLSARARGYNEREKVEPEHRPLPTCMHLLWQSGKTVFASVFRRSVVPDSVLRDASAADYSGVIGPRT